MGDRIATMRDGVLEQVGDPDSVYEQPANTFVASFIGSPAMSLARAGCDSRDGAVQLLLGEQQLELHGAVDLPADVIVGVRPDTRVSGTRSPGCSGRSRDGSSTSKRSAARR